MSVLLGVEFMKNIVVIMTDGDSNEIEESENAIALYFPEYSLWCEWYLIHKGFQWKVPLDASMAKNFWKSFQFLPEWLQIGATPSWNLASARQK